MATFRLGDKACKSNVQDFATFQNATGRQLTLNLCQGRIYGEVQTLVLADGINQEVALGSHEGTTVQGGIDAAKSCSAAQSKMEMGISLAPTSFSQVKLCYDEVSKLNVVVENHQSCPSGYLEQTTTGSCDSL
jgi:hypothetical protein